MSWETSDWNPNFQSLKFFMSSFVTGKLYRALAVYLGSSWVLVEAASYFADRYSFPHYFVEMLMILLAFGLVSLIYSNWLIHVQKKETLSRKGIFVNVVNFIIALIVLYSFWRSEVDNDIQHYTGNDTEKISIAVLPFEDLSPEKNHEWLGNTISDRMIDQLALIQTIDVKSRSASFYFKGKDFNLVQIARLLKVNTVLEGSVLVIDSTIQVSVKLVNPISGSMIWNETFQRPYSKLMEFQAEVAIAVANRIGARISITEKKEVNKPLTENSKAYELYLMGRYHYNLLTVTDLNRAHDYFQKAIALDPDFAEAYAYLGMTYNIFGGYWLGLTPNKAYKEIEKLAEKALSINPDLPMAHFLKSQVIHFYDRNYKEGLKLAGEAYQMATNKEDMVWLYSLMLSINKKGDQAIEVLNEYIATNPTSPPAFQALCAANLIYYYRNPEVSIDSLMAPCHECLELDSSMYYAKYYIAEGFFARREYEKAKEVYNDLVRMTPAPHFVEGLMRMNYYSGDTTTAMALFGQLEIMSKQITIPYVMARAYSTLGDFDKMILNLEKAYEIRDIEIVNLWLDGTLDPAREDPRFKEILSRMKYAGDFK